MKRGTPDHPKMIMLTMELEKVYVAHRKKSLFGGKAEAIGTLEILWEWCSKYAIQGNIGKWPDEVIARAIEWRFSGKELISCLVSSHWLDEVPGPDRLVIHDIKDHATNTWRQNLQDAGLTWWDGSPPRKYSIRRSGVSTPEKLQKNSRISPQPEPEPEPEPEPKTETTIGNVHAPDSPPEKRGPLARSLENVLKISNPPPLPTNGAIRQTREALASEISHVPDERIVSRIVQAAREEDPEISDAEVALWVHACTPDGSANQPRGPAWFERVVAAHIRERPRDVTLLRAFVRGELPTSQADGVLADARANPRLLKALRVWRFQQTESQSIENIPDAKCS